MNPSIAAWMTANGSRDPSDRDRTDRPMTWPTAVAPRMTTNTPSVSTGVLSSKITTSLLRRRAWA